VEKGLEEMGTKSNQNTIKKMKYVSEQGKKGRQPEKTCSERKLVV